MAEENQQKQSSSTDSASPTGGAAAGKPEEGQQDSSADSSSEALAKEETPTGTKEEGAPKTPKQETEITPQSPPQKDTTSDDPASAIPPVVDSEKVEPGEPKDIFAEDEVTPPPKIEKKTVASEGSGARPEVTSELKEQKITPVTPQAPVPSEKPSEPSSTPSSPSSPQPPKPEQQPSPAEKQAAEEPIVKKTKKPVVPKKAEIQPDKSEQPAPTATTVSPEKTSIPSAPAPQQDQQQPLTPPVEASPDPEKVAAPSQKLEQPSVAGSEPSAPAEKASTLETPELNKKEIIKEAHEQGVTPKEEEKINVMPEKFKKMKPKLPGKKASKKTLILAGIIILLVIIGGAGFYLWTQGYFQPVPIKSETDDKVAEEPLPETDQPLPETDQPLPETDQPLAEIEEQVEKVEELVEEPVEPVLSEELTLTAVLYDETGETTITSAQFYLPEGALDPETKLELSGSLVTEEIKEQETFKQSSYEIIGALYTFSPVDIILNKIGLLTISYDETLVDEKWEEDIVLGYSKDDVWTPLPSTIDIENNMLVIELEIFPSDTLALMVDKDKLVPKIEEFQIGKNIPSSTDSDNDGLTDIEENVFSLEVNNPDTDADGIPDSQEIIGLMHPLSADEDKLAMSGLINVYTNPTYSYSFFYPSSWLTRALPDTDNQEVLIITNTGEFFSATVDNNPERLSAVDWYVKQSPQVDKSLLYETIANNQTAVWNPSHLTIYITKDDRVYVLSYSVGIEKEANFKTSFEMIVNSFQFVTQPQGRADGTLIKYYDKPEVYMIENGKKRAFQSGEIFERLEFKWEDVIEIPLTEVYADGKTITGRLDGTLIKYIDSSGIYLIENGKKRAFQSGELFETLGFKWEDVIEIQLDETYPDGPIIESSITSTPRIE